MRHDGSVVIRKGGFLTAFFTGLFGLAAVIVITAGTLGFYALNLVDRKATLVLEPTLETVRGLVGNWQENLPPALADAVDDRRAPEYRGELEVMTRVIDRDRHGRTRVAVSILNNGDEMVTLLAGRVVVLNAEGTPIDTEALYAATPITIDDDDWNGPIMPHSKRQIVEYVGRFDSAAEAEFEITDLRVWKKTPPAVAALP